MRKKTFLGMMALMVIGLSYGTVNAKTQSEEDALEEVGDGGSDYASYKCSNDPNNTCIVIKKGGKVIYTEKGVLSV